jgi:hypothetical protein
MTEVEEPTAIATRLAVIVSTAMNLSALLADEVALSACDPAELRSALTSIAEGLRWMRSLANTSGIHGISWPADPDARIASLETSLATWTPGEPVSRGVAASARRALEMLEVGAGP